MLRILIDNAWPIATFVELSILVALAWRWPEGER
jgi:hypothetical protein